MAKLSKSLVLEKIKFTPPSNSDLLNTLTAYKHKLSSQERFLDKLQWE